MEKISAACALGWSIDLEKGLRSRKPGRHTESILQIGPRLNHWNREPLLTLGMCTMFGLVPGEDRVLADAILFRLADAFVSGDKDTRISIIKVFFTNVRHCSSKGQTCPIFANITTEIRLELLRRVKVVLHVDCVKSRALTFILLGCWAEFAKDVAEIRDAVFSSLTSRHGLEVRASLFTAGCFSEYSDDFGYVFLERLLTLMTSQKTLPALKIAGARSFAKIGGSLLHVTRAHKAGAELLRKIFEDDVKAAVLVSLTKLSLKTAILIPDQVGLLCSFLCQMASSEMQARVLRCLCWIGEKSASFVPPGAFPFQSLLRMLDEPSTPSDLRCEILQILFKMIANGLPDLLLKDKEEFMELLRYVENATRSPFLSERVLAFETLVCISTKLKGRIETISVFDPVKFSSEVAASILDQITVLVNRLSGGTSSSEVVKELEIMLRLLLVLVGDYIQLGYFILERLHLVIENLVNSHNMPAPKTHKPEVHKIVDAGTKANILPLRALMLHVHKFLVAFLGSLHEAGSTTEQVVCKLEQLIFLICGSSLFDCSIHTIYSLIWHSHVSQSRPSSESKTSSTCVEGQSRSSSKLLECETAIHMCVENMLAGGDNWCAYKAGRYATCEGAWDVAKFIFHHLERKVQSDFCCQWLKLLSQFTNFEKNVKVLLFQTCFWLPSDHVEPRAANDSHRTTIRIEYIEQLVGACNDISSSDKGLEAFSVKTQAFYFQRWFLALRLKLLHVLIDILKFLDKFLFCKDGIGSSRHHKQSDVICGNPLLSGKEDMNSSLIGLSSKLVSLAEEFDLVASSFVDMDSRSLKAITELALSCSLLAFCTQFATSITYQNLTKTSADCQSTIDDLVGRLWHMDPETCMNLLSLVKENGVHERSSSPKFRPSKVGCISDDILTVCRRSVKWMIELQYQSLIIQNEDAVAQVCNDGMQSLLNVVETWIHIPLRIPSYFFKLRRSIGSLLFWSSAGVGKQKQIFVSPGSHLALDLCIQLKDVPSDICSRFSKLYCILYCRKSFSAAGFRGEPSAESGASYRASETDTMIHLNKRLQCYVMKQSREFMSCRDPHNAGEVVEAYVCFETSGRTQGFSTCLLNVSTLPVGSYRTYWHCAGIDHRGAYHSFLPLCQGPQFTVR